MRPLEGNALFHTDKNIREGILEGMGSKVINNFKKRNDFLIYEAVRQFSCKYDYVIFHS
jgi:hypothetical protein